MSNGHNDNERQHFTFYLSFERGIEKLNDHDQLLIYRAISRYSLFGEEPILEGLAAIAWEFIYPILRVARIRSESGRKGGAPSEKMIGNQNARKQTKNKANSNQKQSKNKAKTKEYINIDEVVNKSISNDISLFPPSSSAHTREGGGEEKREIFLDEIEDYIRENGLRVDAEEFYEHYERNGWMLGNTKMRDWRAVLRRWDQRAAAAPRPNPRETSKKPNDMWK